MVTQIRKGSKGHLYIEEHIAAKQISFDTLGNRLGVSRTTVWRWAKEQHRLDPGKIAALADALELSDPSDLFRLPERSSIDAIMKDAPQGIYDAVVEHAKQLRKAS